MKLFDCVRIRVYAVIRLNTVYLVNMLKRFIPFHIYPKDSDTIILKFKHVHFTIVGVFKQSRP